MAWISLIILAFSFICFLPHVHGSANKKLLFQEPRLIDHFSQTLVNELASSQVIDLEQLQELISGLRKVFIENQDKQVNKIKHALATKIAEIITESIQECCDFDYNLEEAVQAIALALKDVIGVIDHNFIKSIRDIATVMYNNDVEDAIEEAEEQAAEIQVNALTNTTNAQLFTSEAENHVSVQQINQIMTTTTTTTQETTASAPNDTSALQQNSTNEVPLSGDAISSKTQANNEVYNITKVQENHQGAVSTYTDKQETSTDINYVRSIQNSVETNILAEKATDNYKENTVNNANMQQTETNTKIVKESQIYDSNIPSTYTNGQTTKELQSVLTRTNQTLTQQAQEVTVTQQSAEILNKAQQLEEILTPSQTQTAQLQTEIIQSTSSTYETIPDLLQIASTGSTYTASDLTSTLQSSDTVEGSTAATSQFTSINYEAIQSSLDSTLLSSSALSLLSQGILSSSDVLRAVVQALTTVGVSSGIAQKIANQYISFLDASSSIQSFVSAISAAAIFALRSAGSIAPGQESAVAQSLASSIISILSSIASQKPPYAPAYSMHLQSQSIPGPLPTSRPVAPLMSSTIASTSSTSSTSTLSAQYLTEMQQLNPVPSSPVPPSISTNYQAIQNSLEISLRSSNALRLLSGGILSSSDVLKAVVEALSTVGVLSGTARIIASQYISSLDDGLSVKSSASAISTAAVSVLRQAGNVAAGQESAVAQSLTSSIISSLNTIAFQKSLSAPASQPQPVSRPLFAPRPAAILPSATIASASSISSASSTQYFSATQQSNPVLSAPVPQLVSTNYEAIQNSLEISLRSSNALRLFSDGILSSSDVLKAVAQALSNAGVLSGTAQTIANQYISSLGVGSSIESSTSTISTAVVSALREAGNVAPGQELGVAQFLTSSIVRSLSAIASQRSLPAPAPRPQLIFRPVPTSKPSMPLPSAPGESPSSVALVSPVVSDVGRSTSEYQAKIDNQQISGAASDFAASAPSVPLNFGDPPAFFRVPTANLTALSKVPSSLLSSAAFQRISTLSNTIKSIISFGSISYIALSNALSAVANQIGVDTGLSASEVLAEALLETLVALLQYLSPSATNPNDVASLIVESLVQAMD